MIDLFRALNTFGTHTLEFLWFPLLVWTALALPIAIILHHVESIPPIYQYHGRVGLLLALPLGIGTSYFVDFLSSTSQSMGAATTFFVVQNPISASATATSTPASSALLEPMVWIGGLAWLLLGGAAFQLLKLGISFLHLKKTEINLDFKPLDNIRDLGERLPENHLHDKTKLAFSNQAHIPFTYGWPRTKIVIPEDLKNEPEKLAMAVQHELMHIKHRDFLLNGVLVAIKSLFWIHPLTHYLHNTSKEYREITCDSEVLANNHFSKKQYAKLLYELAKREHQTVLAMSMAVNPSTLKKRIQIMSTQTFSSSNFRSSLLLTFIFSGLVILTIACSDISSDGITKQEVEQTQSQVATNSDKENLPLMIVNGEIFTNKDKVTRIKSKYIKHIKVLKDKKATDKYGSKAKNGALEITLNNPEKALTDLKDEELLLVQKSRPSSESKDVYISVDKMPKLNGGLASLQKKINYPEEARKANTQGRVIVQFIVDKQGNVVNPKIIKGVGNGLDEEALRVVKQADFEPGTQNGKPVRVQYSLPITYRLPDKKG